MLHKSVIASSLRYHQMANTSETGFHTVQGHPPSAQQSLASGAGTSSRLTDEVVELSRSMASQLNLLNKQVSQLQTTADTLQQHSRKTFSDRAVQADLGAHAYALQSVRKHDMAQPFSFRAPNKRIPWKRIRQLNVSRLVDSTGTAEVMDVFEDVAYGDLEGESVFNLSEGNIMKLFQLAQLQLQYMQYKLEQVREEQQHLEEGTLAVRSRLAAMPALNLGEEQAALVGLERHMRQLGDTHVDAMFEQVRGQERDAAQAALSDAIQTARQRINVKHGITSASGGTAGNGDVAVPDSQDQLHFC